MAQPFNFSNMSLEKFYKMVEEIIAEADRRLKEEEQQGQDGEDGWRAEERRRRKKEKEERIRVEQQTGKRKAMEEVVIVVDTDEEDELEAEETQEQTTRPQRPEWSPSNPCGRCKEMGLACRPQEYAHSVVFRSSSDGSTNRTYNSQRSISQAAKSSRGTVCHYCKVAKKPCQRPGVEHIPKRRRPTAKKQNNGIRSEGFGDREEQNVQVAAPPTTEELLLRLVTAAESIADSLKTYM